MSFARAMARREKKARTVGTKRGEKKATHIINQSYVYQYRAEADYRKEVIKNLWDIYQYVMIVKYRFGHDRLLRLKTKTWNEFEALMAGNVHVREVDDFLRQEIKFSCGLSAVDKNADRAKQIEDKAIREVSAAVFMALLDEFGFKSRRLVNVCHYAFEFNNMLQKHELSYSEIRERIAKVMARGQHDKGRAD